LQVLSLSPTRREPFLRTTSLGQDVVLAHQVVTSTNAFYF
jgi:hypothetical protein